MTILQDFRFAIPSQVEVLHQNHHERTPPGNGVFVDFGVSVGKVVSVGTGMSVGTEVFDGGTIAAVAVGGI